MEMEVAGGGRGGSRDKAKQKTQQTDLVALSRSHFGHRRVECHF